MDGGGRNITSFLSGHCTCRCQLGLVPGGAALRIDMGNKPEGESPRLHSLMTTPSPGIRTVSRPRRKQTAVNPLSSGRDATRKDRKKTNGVSNRVPFSMIERIETPITSCGECTPSILFTVTATAMHGQWDRDREGLPLVVRRQREEPSLKLRRTLVG